MLAIIIDRHNVEKRAMFETDRMGVIGFGWKIFLSLRKHSAFSEFFRGTYLDEFGSRTVVLITITSALIGGTITYASGHMEIVSPSLYSSYIPHLLGAVFIEHVAPLLTAFLIIGRCAVAIAAELGSSHASQEIDAIMVQGVDPVAFLATPRILALLVVTPVLVFVSAAAGLLGGWLGYGGPSGITLAAFASHFLNVGVPAYATAAGKALISAALIGVLSCYYGIKGDSHTADAGVAVRRTVFWSVLAVTTVNLVSTIIRLQ